MTIEQLVKRLYQHVAGEWFAVPKKVHRDHIAWYAADELQRLDTALAAERAEKERLRAERLAFAIEAEELRIRLTANHNDTLVTASEMRAEAAESRASALAEALRELMDGFTDGDRIIYMTDKRTKMARAALADLPPESH